jgi:hypothetical protein
MVDLQRQLVARVALDPRARCNSGSQLHATAAALRRRRPGDNSPPIMRRAPTTPANFDAMQESAVILRAPPVRAQVDKSRFSC